MPKFGSLLLAILLAIALSWGSVPGHRVKADTFVITSNHLIRVPANAAAAPDSQITLAATLYQPRFFPTAPAVVYIHGWGGRRLIGEDNLAYYIAAAGYVVLSYTARGFGDGESGGQVSLAGPNELSDLSHILDWLTADPDGVIGPQVTKLGVVGGSYGGGHSFQIASDPRLSAVVPLVGWTDLESSLFPNGAINYKLGLDEFYGGLNPSVGTPPFYNYDRLQFEMFDAAAEGRVPGATVKEALSARSIAEPGANGRENLKPFRQPTAPIFIIQSWDDYLFPTSQVLDVYSQITAPKKLYLGRRGHPPGGNESAAEEFYIGTEILRWFNYYLLGVGGTDAKPVASVVAPATFSPTSYSQFPAADATALTLYMKAGNLMTSRRKGPNQEENAGGVFHPNSIRSSRLGAEIPPRGDMFAATVAPSGTLPRALVYTTNPFGSDIEVMGPGEFTFFVASPTSATIDLIVHIYDVSPNGIETEVTVGVFRVSGLTPEETRRVVFRDFGDHWIFRAGHSLRVKVTNIDFPDFRPPGVNDDRSSEFTLRTGKKYPTSLTLAVRSQS